MREMVRFRLKSKIIFCDLTFNDVFVIITAELCVVFGDKRFLFVFRL